MEPHPYGWLSLLPSLVAIVLAIATRRVVLSMFLGIFVGALVTNGGNPFSAVSDTFVLHLWTSLIEEDRLHVFAFTVLMGAMVGVIERSGGMSGLVRVVSRWAKNRQRGQLATWLLGLLVFFDDYANTVLLGNTLQPLCERLKISKEKLSYLVDSTAAPVAGLAVISTWVAGEIDFIRSGLDSLETSTASVSAFTLFIQSIPYRFYVLWSLVFVFLVGLMQRDFGPMLAAERACLAAPIPERRAGAGGTTIRPSGWWNAVIPIVVTVMAVLVLLYRSGTASLRAGEIAEDASLWQIFGEANSYFALLWGSFIGLVTAIVLGLGQRLLTWHETEDATAHGAKLMLPALAVLWLASSLSAMTGHDPVPGFEPSADEGQAYPVRDYRLYTGEFLAGLIQPADDATLVESPGRTGLAPWMPTIVFVLSAGISFATGTSWGTMAIVMPVAIPLAYGALGASSAVGWGNDPVMICTIGSVLAGSIFGDHCSPISDTTVLSSQACGCEHTAHVWTQLPYAFLVGIVSIICGTMPVGFGWPVWLTLPAGCLALFGLLIMLGHRTSEAA